MTDRPIIFSAPMVNALLDGRKTQTRRLLKPQPEPFRLEDGRECEVGLLHVEGRPLPSITLGRVITRQDVRFAVGDRLWVRETFQTAMSDGGPCWLYRANSDRIYPEFDGPDEGAGPSFNYDKYPSNYAAWASDVEARGPWRSPIHMPRWASRIRLTVTDVRVQRLQEISEADAIAEGIERINICGAEWNWKLYGGAPNCGWSDPRQSYQSLWETINGAGSWDANPWIAAVTFTVARRGDDDLFQPPVTK